MDSCNFRAQEGFSSSHQLFSPIDFVFIQGECIHRIKANDQSCKISQIAELKSSREQLCQQVIQTPILPTFCLKNVLSTLFFSQEKCSFKIMNLGILQNNQGRSKHVCQECLQHVSFSCLYIIKFTHSQKRSFSCRFNCCSNSATGLYICQFQFFSSQKSELYQPFDVKCMSLRTAKPRDLNLTGSFCGRNTSQRDGEIGAKPAITI